MMQCCQVPIFSIQEWKDRINPSMKYFDLWHQHNKFFDIWEMFLLPRLLQAESIGYYEQLGYSFEWDMGIKKWNPLYMIWKV